MVDGNTVVMAGMALSWVVWALRLEGRVNTQEKLHEKLAEDVSYIRDRIDTFLNGRSIERP